MTVKNEETAKHHLDAHQRLVERREYMKELSLDVQDKISELFDCFQWYNFTCDDVFDYASFFNKISIQTEIMKNHSLQRFSEEYRKQNII